MSGKLVVVDHPLVQHKLGWLRREDTDSATFRRLLGEIAALLAYELTRELPTERVRLRTPLCEMEAPQLQGPPPALISILRAGNGLLDGVLGLIPTAAVGHIGLYRDPETLEPVQYYFKVPHDLGSRQVLVVDPMLATGHSAVAAVSALKARGAGAIRFLCLLSAPEGVKAFHEAHPDVPIVTAAVDERLNDHGYIVPGLGDAGDRMYGTR
ncbi:MAG: uracil phosphoribosyltransferase [Myxococcota bacterium]